MDFNNFIKIIFILFICLLIIEYCIPKNTFIKRSDINGKGLFAAKNYKVGDIILDNIFPKKPKEQILFNPISFNDFNHYISKEGLHVNHCSNNFNSDIHTEDYKDYKLIATKDILRGKEITANYDSIHKKLPFIAGSKPDYVTC
tara:strand:- start:158 stop:589 length:432 start_codon:yes stop_codon:yes gene_type:complete